MVQRDGNVEQDIKDILATREAMTHKLELLQARVKGTVGGAKHQVTSAVDRVKDTTKSIKRSMSPSYQVDRRPLTMMSGTILVGYLIGSYIGKWKGRNSRNNDFRTAERRGQQTTSPEQWESGWNDSSPRDSSLGEKQQEYYRRRGKIAV